MKQIPGHPNYLATKDGRIFSVAPPNGHGPKRKTPKELSPGRSGNYLNVKLGKKKPSQLVHRLVLLTFKGPSNGRQCRHLDGDPSNNHIDNLEWGTIKENAIDRVKHGRRQGFFKPGDKHPKSKLSSSDVKEIRNLISQNISQTEIASRFNVYPSTISRISRGLRWKHIK